MSIILYRLEKTQNKFVKIAKIVAFFNFAFQPKLLNFQVLENLVKN